MDGKRVVVGRLKAVVGPPEQSPRRAAKVGGEAPEWIQIWPDGEFSYDWENAVETAVCDAASRAQVIATFNERGNDLVVDYEHQTLHGGVAPAAGWIKELEDRGSDGLWARVEWTEQARKLLLSGEYRYDSPVFDVDKETRRVTQLHHVAITNWPATHNRTSLDEQIAAKAMAKYGTSTKAASWRKGSMSDKQIVRGILCWGREIPVTATNNDVHKYVEQLLAQIPKDDNLFILEDEAVEGATSVAAGLGISYVEAAAAGSTTTEIVATKAVLDELGLKEGATLAQVHAKIGELKTPAGVISTSVHQAVVAERDQLKLRVTDLEAKTDEERLTQLIATNRRKVPPAKEPWVRALAKTHGYAHAADVVKELGDAVPADDLASQEPPAAAVETVATTGAFAGRPINEAAALRRTKVEKLMGEKGLDYEAANDELRRQERSTKK